MKRAAIMDDVLRQQSWLGTRATAMDDRQFTPDAEFAALVQRHSRFLFRVAYAILRNASDAEDVVQDAFLRVLRFANWNEVRDERSYLARIAWRLAVERRQDVRSETLPEQLAATGQDPEEATIRADWEHVIHRLLDTLPEELRQPLVLSAIKELDSPQIAAIMQIPEGTVRTRIQRARSILKQKLAARQEKRHESY